MTTMKNMVSSALSSFDVRMVGYVEEEDEFGDLVYKINPHFNDLRNLQPGKSEAMFKMLEQMPPGMRAGYKLETNQILLKKK